MEHQGLKEKEAQKKLLEFGPNRFPQSPFPSDLKILFQQFKSPLIYILLFASLVTIFLKDFTDTLVILVAVLINTILGFYQERKAEQALVKLKNILTPHAKVIRDGKLRNIEADLLVPGDLVVLAQGDKVSADGIVVEAVNLSINEAILTGESMPVSKEALERALRSSTKNFVAADHPDVSVGTNYVKQNFCGLPAPLSEIDNLNKVFMGTTINSGRGKFLVIKTGQETEMGKIAIKLTTLEEEQTPLQKRIAVLARTLAILVGSICGLIFLTGLLWGKNPLEMFTTSVAIAVAAIPEGMVVSLTVILAIGMQRILKRKALVRKLLAAETLGSVTVIATDKTGTLTQGELKVVKTQFTDKNLASLASILVNNQADPLETALWDWTKINSKLRDPQKIIDENPRVFEIPFDSEKKYQLIISNFKDKETKINSNDKDKLMLFMSGAPEVVLSKSKLSENEKKKWLEKIEKWGKEGLRMMALAVKPLDEKTTGSSQKDFYIKEVQDLNWLGLIGFEDPIREGVAEALESCKEAGIKVKIITGDYAETAAAVWKKLIAYEVGPQERSNLSRKDALRFLNGSEIEKMSPEKLKQKVGEIDIFARVTPTQKLKIVEALKENGEVVALVGDGVNDAPALKRADIGIVVGEASDVAKETADIVLLDSNFSTIVAAIEEGRGIFDNLRKVILYLLSDSFSEIFLVLGSLLLGLPLPLTAAQILYINLVTDGFPHLALTVEPKEKGLLKRKPIKTKAPLLNLEAKLLIGLISLVTAVMCLTLFNFFLKRSGLVLARTITFIALGIDSLLYVFSVKSLTKPIFKINLFSNPYLLIAVSLGGILQILSLYNPALRKFLNLALLNSYHWLLILTTSLVVIILIEGVKFFFIKKKWQDR
ncbi:HAD-IC family P-type ATPase [Candidatus Microgenomates bacterium]|nr:HAD-IC family P-type ATPase [Candidatus Microgenomates bacterium]